MSSYLYRGGPTAKLIAAARFGLPRQGFVEQPQRHRAMRGGTACTPPRLKSRHAVVAEQPRRRLPVGGGRRVTSTRTTSPVATDFYRTSPHFEKPGFRLYRSIKTAPKQTDGEPRHRSVD